MTTLDQLNEAIFDLRERFEVEHLVYHSVNSTGEQYAALTYDRRWVERYIAQDYARLDPVVQGCYRRFHPVDWKKLDWTPRATRQFLGEAAESGIGNQGYSVPVRGPSGQFALFTINHRATDAQWKTYRDAHLADLILMAHFINLKALEIERGSDQKPTQKLSPREIDALTLLATGLNRAQAADTLAISEHTLRVYIESARFKLGATNTTHAVARALSCGLLVV
ncbi:helix-turn-helix transcriptional regulator [Oceaniglobus trochenteri]|uniref:helix-turn-helix transcriptional regulator n=1 Tax=Oceaniglobus trochenteri TaxID=2763260 RepID=UPI001CFF9630